MNEVTTEDIRLFKHNQQSLKREMDKRREELLNHLMGREILHGNKKHGKTSIKGRRGIIVGLWVDPFSTKVHVSIITTASRLDGKGNLQDSSN